MAGLPLTALIVCLFMSAGETQGFTIHTEQSRITATVGDDAFFNVTPSAAISGGNWVFNGTTIGQWAGTGESINNAYKSRVEFFTTNGSFLLKSVKVSDSGYYRVDMTPNSGSNAQLTIALRVLDKAANVSQDLKPGAIAGIVIAVIAFVAIGAGSVAFVVKKNFSRFKAGSSPNDIKMASPENIQTQTEYAEIERKHPGQPRPVQSSNGANPAASQAKGGDVIYTSPNIVNPAAKATTEPVIDSKTDYAELKYR